MHNRELTMRQVQEGAYQVLKKITALCDQHGWKYILTYGTMLGAVRHQGVIPWDDDIDIMMPRPDYEKMKQYFLQNEEALAPLKWFDKSTVSSYPHMIARIGDQRYHLEFDNEKDYGIGLFVDVYPMDGVGSDYDAAIKQIHKNKRLSSLCFLTGRKKFSADNTHSKLKMIVKFPAYCWANLWGNQHYIDKLGASAQNCDYENSKYVACLTWPGGKYNGHETDVMEKSIFEDLIVVPFEDGFMKIPREYDSFLTSYYGDYMQPPPEDARTTNHTYRAYEL